MRLNQPQVHRPLTAMQRAFVVAMLTAPTQREAAIAAGYAPATAARMASRLVRNRRVAGALALQRQAARAAAGVSDPFSPGRFDDPADFLQAVADDPVTSPALRVRAAVALLPYTHARRR